MLLLLVIAALVVILNIYRRLRDQRRKAGIRGWVLDQDLDGKGQTVYRDARLGVSCKPDIVQRRRIIEYKSATVHGKARSGDILYVASQMLATGKDEAELRYANTKFVFARNSTQMQAAMHKVRSIIGEMRRHLSLSTAPKGTPTKNKCTKCVFKASCTEAA